MEMSWRDRCINALKYAVWVLNNPGGSYEEFHLIYNRKSRTTFYEWSARVDHFQKTGRWV